jgi:antitoxin component of MazEF toxin-antitoxin module
VLPALKRKIRKISDSLVIGIPSEIVELNNLKEGEFLAWDQEGSRMVLVKVVASN